MVDIRLGQQHSVGEYQLNAVIQRPAESTISSIVMVRKSFILLTRRLVGPNPTSNQVAHVEIFAGFRDPLKKVLRDYLGIFPKFWTPPPPPLLGIPYSKKNFIYFAL